MVCRCSGLLTDALGLLTRSFGLLADILGLLSRSFGLLTSALGSLTRSSESSGSFWVFDSRIFAVRSSLHRVLGVLSRVAYRRVDHCVCWIVGSYLRASYWCMSHDLLDGRVMQSRLCAFATLLEPRSGSL